jgi:hypothetical protein
MASGEFSIRRSYHIPHRLNPPFFDIPRLPPCK